MAKKKAAKKGTAKKGKGAGSSKLKLISGLAKKIYDPSKMKWTDAIKKASAQLKKEGKI